MEEGELLLGKPSVDAVEVGEEAGGVLSPAMTLALGQASPNPFSHITQISFSIPRGERATFRVYDASGRLVKVLSDGSRSSAVTWDGRDEAGRRLPGGVYFYRLESGNHSLTRKLVILR